MWIDENIGCIEVLNLMLVFGNIFDIVGFSCICDFVNQYGFEGVFVLFNDLIVEYVFNIVVYYEMCFDIEVVVKVFDG